MGPENSSNSQNGSPSSSLSSGDNANSISTKQPYTNAALNTSEFLFTQSDYVTKQSGVDSAFDRLLKKKWNAASDSNVMKYNIVRHSLPSRLIDSTPYRFIASLIEGRAPGKRRQPEEMLALRMPFDPIKFNFTKIESNELLFQLKCDNLEHSVIVNKSPIEYCSALLVPSLKQCLPQVTIIYLQTFNLMCYYLGSN